MTSLKFHSIKKNTKNIIFEFSRLGREFAQCSKKICVTKQSKKTTKIPLDSDRLDEGNVVCISVVQSSQSVSHDILLIASLL